jgi:hypothetical protein
MTINLTNETRYDTRGLPVGYDPHKLYEYRLDTLAKNSSGLESFLYRLMPPSLIQSLAFAVDPTARYKVSSQPITPANRIRYRGVASVLQQRKTKRTRDFSRWGQEVNYQSVSLCWSPYLVYDGFSVTLSEENRSTQSVLHNRIKDTTRRTRLFGSSQGTFEKFKGELFSPPRASRLVVSESSVFPGAVSNEPACGMVGGTYQHTSGSNDIYIERITPTAAVLSVSAFNNFRDGEINLCHSMSQTHAISLLKSVEPFAVDYTLFRNLVELRDVPRSVRQLQTTANDLRKLWLSLRHIPKTRKVVF